MALNINNPTPIKLGDKVLRYVNQFTYLRSVFTKGGGADEDINSRLSQSQNSFQDVGTSLQIISVQLYHKDKVIPELCCISVALWK